MIKKIIRNIRYRNIVLFLFVIMMAGFVFGIEYYFKIKSTGNFNYLISSLLLFKDNVMNVSINNILLHLFLFIISFLLSVFIIGIPLVLLILFFELFSVGFTLSAFLSVLGFRFFILGILYFFITKFFFLLMFSYFIVKCIRISFNELLFFFRKLNTVNNIFINMKKIVLVVIFVFIYDVVIFVFSPIIMKLVTLFV